MKREAGQAVLETALVLPILILLLCSIIDFGRILYTSMQLNMVTQEAVRMAGLGDTDEDIIAFVNDKAVKYSNDTISVDITPGYNLRKSGDYVTLRIKYEMEYITPIIKIFLPSPFLINTQSTIRVE